MVVVRKDNLSNVTTGVSATMTTGVLTTVMTGVTATVITGVTATTMTGALTTGMTDVTTTVMTGVIAITDETREKPTSSSTGTTRVTDVGTDAGHVGIGIAITMVTTCMDHNVALMAIT